VITTIMFNFIAATLIVYLLVEVIGKPGSMQPETPGFRGARHPDADASAARAASASSCRRRR
jgi:ABC-type uncharacterized transport system permease subunit